MLPAGVTSFPELVQWIADHHHHGIPFHIAHRLGTSPGTPYLWISGLVKIPERRSIEGLCKEYGLDFWEVWDLVQGRPGQIPTQEPAKKLGSKAPPRRGRGIMSTPTTKPGNVASLYTTGSPRGPWWGQDRKAV